MAIADTSTTRLAYVAETTEGTTPSTPAFKVLRYTSEDITLTKETIVSGEIRADRNVGAITDVARNVTGNVNFEMSYGSFDDLWEALLCGTWSTNVVKNGITPRSFTFEKTFEQGSTDSYIRYRGCRIGSANLNLNPKGMITGSFGLNGIGSPTPTTAIITGATYAAASTVPVLNAATNVGTLTVGGVAATPKIRSLSIEITNNLYELEQIAAYEPVSYGLGKFEVRGTMETYFEDLDLYNALVGHTDLSLLVKMGNAANNNYTLSLPKIKLLSGSPPVTGNSAAVMLNVPFQAYYDSSSVATVTLTRAVA